MNNNAIVVIDGIGEVPLKYGMAAVRHVFDKMATLELTLGDYYNETGIAHILYAGYLNKCIVKDEAPKIPFEVFYEFVENDENTPEQIDQLTNAVRVFEQSKFIKRLVEVVEEKKSQLNGKTSKLLDTENSD